MLIWAAFLALVLFSAAAYVLGRRRVLASGPAGPRPHSRPGYHGAYVALWAAAPALLVLMLYTAAGGGIEQAIVRADPPAAIAGLSGPQQQVFFNDAQALAHGARRSEIIYEPAVQAALDDTAGKGQALGQVLRLGALALATVLAVGGAFLALRRLSPDFRARNRVEGWTAGLLVLCSVVAVLTTVGIVASLAYESLRFFQSVSPIDFLFGTTWDPQIAMRADQVAAKGAFGAVPLFAGTFLIMLIAMTVAA
ncbi:phosphate ABC transporter permease family protein, partial [Phenylobacterium sp.]|uniref:phosphate ABC transporter permease family protein n=1 Tax=Phenylobacterium sp. TaxID=1871053 RepID=UPI003784FAE9